MKRYDQFEGDTAFDAVVIDVNRFSALNKQYGRPFGDLILRSVGAGIKNLIRKTGGIGGRKGEDTFLFYGPHQDSWEPLVRDFLADVYTEIGAENTISLRIGVYANAQGEAGIEERFVHANYAADSVRNVPSQLCGYYPSGAARSEGTESKRE